MLVVLRLLETSWVYVQLKIQEENVSELRAAVFVGLLLCFVKVLVIRNTSYYLCF